MTTKTKNATTPKQEAKQTVEEAREALRLAEGRLKDLAEEAADVPVRLRGGV